MRQKLLGTVRKTKRFSKTIIMVENFKTQLSQKLADKIDQK